MQRFPGPGWFLLTCLILWGVAPGAMAQEMWSLAYTLRAGQIITATTVLDVSGTYQSSSSELPTVEPQPHPANYSLVMVRRLEILDRDESGSTVKEELVSLEQVIGATTAIPVYASARLDKYSPLMPQLGGSVRYRITDRGYTISLQGAGGDRSGFGSALGGTLFLFPRLPDGPVRAGENWSPGSRSMPLGGMEGVARVDYSARLAESATPVATLEFARHIAAQNLSHRLSRPVESATSVRDFFWAVDDLQIDTTGTARLDLAAGQLRETESRVRFESRVRGMGTMYVENFRIQVEQSGVARNRTVFRYH